LGDRLPSDSHFKWLASCVGRKGPAAAAERAAAIIQQLLPCQPGRTHLSASGRFSPTSFIYVDSGAGKSGTVVT